MGSGMALNLHKAGRLHGVWNRTRSKAERIAVQTGVILFESPAGLASECELVILCVSRDADVLAMVEQVAFIRSGRHDCRGHVHRQQRHGATGRGYIGGKKRGLSWTVPFPAVWKGLKTVPWP